MSRARLASRSFPEGEIRSMEGLPVVNPRAAGADIGAQQIFVCIPGPGQTQIVRSFGTYTADLRALADWLHRERHPDHRHGIHRRLLDSAL